MLANISKPMEWESTISMSYDQLWEGMRAGREEALGKLLYASYSQLFNYAAQIHSNQDLIKDSIQELFLILWDRRHAINEAQSVKTYLFFSLRRIMLRKLTKRRNRKERNRAYYDNYFEDTFSVEELIVHFETEESRKKAFFKAIHSLNGRQKEALYLKFYDGLTTQEISYVMDINKQSVYNHISEAINKLQTYVKV